MPEKGEEVILTVEGAQYDGWEEVRIQRSMTQIAGTFALKLTDKYPGQPGRLRITDQSPCAVSIGGTQVIKGFVERFKPSYSDSSHDISVSGKDATADLVRCSILGPPTQWKQQTLLQIANDICKPFGIPVVAEGALRDINKPFFDISANEGDAALSLINKLCQQRGVLPVSYGDGKLTLTTAEKARAGGAIKYPGNIKTGSVNYDSSKRFSEYHIKGQGAATGPANSWGDLTGEDRQEHQAGYIAPTGKAEDTHIRRYLPKVILADAEGDAESFERRAIWEATVRGGQSRKLNYKVTGWKNATGQLWAINTLCTVDDKLLGASGRWLLESLTFIKSESEGTITQLQLVHPDAYKPLAQPEKIKSGYDYE
jgi:prophage tail gpP-like protein